MSSPPLLSYGSGAYGAEPIERLPLGYYLGLVSSEHSNSPKFMAFLQVLLQKFADISQVLVAFDAAFDIDNAVGPQLDLAGAIVGANRTVGFQPSGGVSPVLDDATYRILIKATAAKNSFSGKIDALQTIWQSLFPGGSIIIGDNQDMSATIFISGTFTSIELDLINNGYIVPRPQGVRYNYVFSSLPFPVFGCDNLNPSLVAGFDVGHFAGGYL